MLANVYAQEPEPIENDRFVLVPREICMPVIVFQPSTPLQFESAERLMKIGGGGANTYRLRNISKKSIRSFRVSYLFGEGTGGSWEWISPSSESIKPGELAPSTAGNTANKIIPLTDDMRAKLELRGSMKTVVFYIVDRVEFTDGSSYSDESALNALKAYLDDLSDRAYRGDQQREKRSTN
jgi:hypothetical protein